MIEVKYKDDLRKIFWRKYDALTITDWEDANIEDIIKCYNNWGKTRKTCHMHFDGIESLFAIDPLEATRFHILICSECKHKIPISVILNADSFLKFCPYCGSKILDREE